ncbi:MAG TPA: hypothetical protein VHA14_18935 [Bryobacteraceae bacterium]|nr:hypothetical protein [Bryobacteraceae bacterium]
MRAFVCFALALSAPVAAFAVEQRPIEAALANIHRIYVDQLGGGKTSDQFRDMLIASMQSTGLFVLTENPDRADAVLRGSGDDLIYTEERGSSDSIGVHANAGESSSSRARNSGASASASAGVGVSDSEASHSEERRHEATGSVRLVDKNGDVIWSTTQESDGGKFRSAMADVADKIVRQLADETKKMRDAAEETRNSNGAPDERGEQEKKPR